MNIFATADLTDWKPSLTMESVMEMPELKALIKEEQVSTHPWLRVSA